MGSLGRNTYYWRQLSVEQRASVLAMRQAFQRPWHSPPHGDGPGRFLLTAACYEHAPLIGRDWQRLGDFADHLLAALDATSSNVSAWVVLPNHYHAVVCTPSVRAVLRALARLHGRTSHQWNGDDATRGRKVWCSAVDTRLESERYLRAAINYVHHNPVRHGYAETWHGWPFSSAVAYLKAVGREQAARDWR